MRGIYLQDIFKLGSSINHILNYSRGVYDSWVGGERIIEDRQMYGLLDSLMIIEKELKYLKICDKTSQEIHNFCKKIESDYEPDSDLNETDRKLLRRAVAIWEDRIVSNLEKQNAVLFERCCMLNPKDLLKGPERFFDKEVWQSLDKSTKDDLGECCKCLVFELPTAAGFMALRATESVLKEYYKNKTDEDETQSDFINWKSMLNKLEKQEVEKSLLKHLDFLRDNLRNPLAHPGGYLQQREAENIFSMIALTVSSMIKDMHSS